MVCIETELCVWSAASITSNSSFPQILNLILSQSSKDSVSFWDSSMFHLFPRIRFTMYGMLWKRRRWTLLDRFLGLLSPADAFLLFFPFGNATQLSSEAPILDIALSSGGGSWTRLDIFLRFLTINSRQTVWILIPESPQEWELKKITRNQELELHLPLKFSNTNSGSEKPKRVSETKFEFNLSESARRGWGGTRSYHG